MAKSKAGARTGGTGRQREDIEGVVWEKEGTREQGEWDTRGRPVSQPPSHPAAE